MVHQLSIDRTAPAEEPAAPAFLRQDWHHLLFLHWEIPPQELQPLVAPELTIDTFDGHAYVGLVPFTLTGVRPVLTPAMPWISSFHEVNVRTYVHRAGRDPGVWFFSLDASSAIAVAAARAAYHLPYFHAAMDLQESAEDPPLIDFQSRRNDPGGTAPAGARIRYAPMDGIVKHAAPGTIEHFLIERYILYTVDDEHRLCRARIHHEPYSIQRADVLDCEETMIWAAGIKRPGSAPLRHYAREVNAKIYALEKL
ncbi:MAG TPA: DUF2071 domain-containing protein [Thermoanaerobaculia bacterium]|nr:DUF2071 domain-containing protein [Thermoanaerobaculia bacterium]